MSFTATVALAFRRYGDFNGRAPRSEFWWWILFIALSTAVLSAIPYPASSAGLGAAPGSPWVTVWELVVLLPTLAVLVRRLRDAGLGWGHVFWALLPVAGLVVLVVLALRPSARPAVPSASSGQPAAALEHR